MLRIPPLPLEGPTRGREFIRAPQQLKLALTGTRPHTTMARSNQMALAAIFTVSASSVTLKMNEMMPWAETV